MANELIPEDSVNLPINDLCRNSIELVEYARSIAARQINLVQLILLCKEKDDALVEITLPENSNIYASEYQLYLPDKKELQIKLKEWIAEETGGEES